MCVCLYCFRELFDRCPNQHTSLLLGDAYMEIQEVGIQDCFVSDFNKFLS